MCDTLCSSGGPEADNFLNIGRLGGLAQHAYRYGWLATGSNLAECVAKSHEKLFPRFSGTALAPADLFAECCASLATGHKSESSNCAKVRGGTSAHLPRLLPSGTVLDVSRHRPRTVPRHTFHTLAQYLSYILARIRSRAAVFAHSWPPRCGF